MRQVWCNQCHQPKLALCTCLPTCMSPTHPIPHLNTTSSPMLRPLARCSCCRATNDCQMVLGRADDARAASSELHLELQGTHEAKYKGMSCQDAVAQHAHEMTNELPRSSWKHACGMIETCMERAISSHAHTGPCTPHPPLSSICLRLLACVPPDYRHMLSNSTVFTYATAARGSQAGSRTSSLVSFFSSSS